GGDSYNCCTLFAYNFSTCTISRNTSGIILSTITPSSRGILTNRCTSEGISKPGYWILHIINLQMKPSSKLICKCSLTRFLVHHGLKLLFHSPTQFACSILSRTSHHLILFIAPCSAFWPLMVRLSSAFIHAIRLLIE